MRNEYLNDRAIRFLKSAKAKAIAAGEPCGDGMWEKLHPFCVRWIDSNVTHALSENSQTKLRDLIDDPNQAVCTQDGEHDCDKNHVEDEIVERPSLIKRISLGIPREFTGLFSHSTGARLSIYRDRDGEYATYYVNDPTKAPAWTWFTEVDLDRARTAIEQQLRLEDAESCA